MRCAKSLAVLSALALLTATACGPGAPREQVIVKLEVTAALDGSVRSDGTFDAAGGNCAVGDLDGETNGLGSRMYFSFDLSSIPQPVLIVYADVCCGQTAQFGSPYVTHGETSFEHVLYGDALDGSDYDAPVLAYLGGHATGSPDTQLSGRCLSVTSAVAADLAAGRTRFQFRIRCANFDSDADGVSDYTVWADWEHAATSTAVPAEMTIVYRPIRTR